MSLGTRIPDMFGADPHDPIQHGPIPPCRLPKLCPIPPLSANDDVVDRGEGETAGIDVAVTHGYGGGLHVLPMTWATRARRSPVSQDSIVAGACGPYAARSPYTGDGNRG